jgi:hypothetical protein
MARLGGGKKRDMEGLDPEALRRAARPDRRRQLTGEEAQVRSERLNELAVLSLFLHSAGTMEKCFRSFWSGRRGSLAPS